jgi:alpha-glucoside transport system permease protein
MNPVKIRAFFSNLPTHIVVIALCLIWLIPVMGLFVTSFRDVRDANETGWWMAFSPRGGGAEYEQYCGECHGPDGATLAAADLSSAEFVANYPRSLAISATFNDERGGVVHIAEGNRPDGQTLADILAYLKRETGLEVRPRFTLSNYVDSLVGYRGTNTYAEDCETGTVSSDLTCDFVADLGNSRGMAQAFKNTILVAIPSTILPLIFAAFAAYAFSWLEFKGRMLLFALVVALQVVPLQLTLVPISRLYLQMGLGGTFLGVWLFHTGFGLPYAVYLTRNFMGSLPRELFESAYLDGASHWTAFRRLALPLSMPALASLAIFQFLWIWNDLLVALVFLTGRRPVLTYQINNLVQSLGGGWHLLTSSAFLSMIVPIAVFFAFQRFFVRGLLAGSVKG